MTTFFPQGSGIRYPRCEIPARAIGAKILEFDEELALGDLRLNRQDGVGVWQLAANRVRIDGMIVSRARAGAVVYEADDDYTRWDERYSRGARWTAELPPLEDRSASSPEIVKAAVALSDLVIVSTSHLGTVYSQFNDNVWICPSCVDPDDWGEPLDRDETFRILFAGSPNSFDMALIREGMEWAAEQENVEAWVFGKDPGWAGVKTAPWVRDLSSYRQIMRTLRPDIGLRPLLKNEFSRGKSDLKILEYAMAGAFSIVTDWTPYEDWESGDALRVDDDDWLDAIQDAVAHREEMRELARQVRELVVKTRGLETARQQWSAAISSLGVADVVRMPA